MVYRGGIEPVRHEDKVARRVRRRVLLHHDGLHVRPPNVAISRCHVHLYRLRFGVQGLGFSAHGTYKTVKARVSRGGLGVSGRL